MFALYTERFYRDETNKIASSITQNYNFMATVYLWCAKQRIFLYISYLSAHLIILSLKLKLVLLLRPARGEKGKSNSYQRVAKEKKQKNSGQTAN